MKLDAIALASRLGDELEAQAGSVGALADVLFLKRVSLMGEFDLLRVAERLLESVSVEVRS